MHTSTLMVVHIIFGTLSILSGFTGLFSRKGGKLHKRIGNLFFYSMIGMSTTGSYLAILNNGDMGTTMISQLVLYMVLTSQITIKAPPKISGWMNLAALGFGIIIIGLSLYFGIDLELNPDEDSIYPPFAFYIVAGIATFACGLDLRVIYLKGIKGKQRLVRHLWRMTFALFVTSISLFIGQPQVFPVFIQESGLLYVPVLLVFTMMLFWVVYTYTKKNTRSKLS